MPKLPAAALLVSFGLPFGLSFTAMPVMAQAPAAPIRHIDYPPEFTADQILNGNLPRPASPPPLPVTFDDSGFAKERLFHVPAPGVHPRILFGPQDIPGIKARLASTQSGRQMLAFSRAQLAKGIDKPGTWENQLYLDLQRGDLVAFAKLYKPQEVPPVAGNSVGIPADAPATKWHHRDPFGMALEVKAFVCLLDNDTQQGAALGKAIANFALYFKPRIEKAAAGPFGDDWWRTMRSAVDGWPFLPYAYDFDYNFMTAEQQRTTRGVLSLLTKGRYSLGMELPPHWRIWNFLGLSTYEALFSLAIEGEEGYDPRIYKRTVELIRDYLAYSINPSGMAHESVGYHSAGMSHTTFTMIAMANRGDNLFTESHYRAMFDQWFLQTLQPYGGEWFSDGDLGNFPVGTEPTMVNKYFYPNDRKLDYVFQNTPEVRKGSFGTDLYIVEAMITASDPDRDASGKLVDYKAGAVFELPPSYTDDARGVMITRDKWTKDGLYLNFECHPDTVFASHDHADRGRFVLTALGRNWAWQDSRPHETAEASSVLIDDVGQGFFPTYAKWLGHRDSAQGAFASCDASYAYDWKWRKEAGMWPDDDPRFKTPFYATQRNNSPELDPAITEYEPSPQIVAFYKPYLAGNPRLWDEDSWVVRQANNPVKFAFRSAGVVRGAHPYAVVIDDLQKDSGPHVYKWLMQLEEDLQVESQTKFPGGRDIVMMEKTGDRRLLVRVLDDAGAPSAEGAAQHFGADFKLQGMAAEHPVMYRLTVPTTATVFRGKVILYPFVKGDQLPAITWDARTGKAALRWQDAADELDFTAQPDGRTTLQVMRNGVAVAVTP